MQNGCQQCHVGIKNVKPIRFRREPKQKHSQFIGLNWIFDEIFVRDIVKSVFQEEKITGVKYIRPILHKNDEPLKTIFQLKIDTILNEGLITDNLEYEICQEITDKKLLKPLKTQGSSLVKGPYCGQKKYHYPKRSTIVFKRELFSNQPDFVKTNEWFGTGGQAYRFILVSRKIRDIIIKHKWRGALLRPVELI